MAAPDLKSPLIKLAEAAPGDDDSMCVSSTLLLLSSSGTRSPDEVAAAPADGEGRRGGTWTPVSVSDSDEARCSRSSMSTATGVCNARLLVAAAETAEETVLDAEFTEGKTVLEAEELVVTAEELVPVLLLLLLLLLLGGNGGNGLRGRGTESVTEEVGASFGFLVGGA